MPGQTLDEGTIVTVKLLPGMVVAALTGQREIKIRVLKLSHKISDLIDRRRLLASWSANQSQMNLARSNLRHSAINVDASRQGFCLRIKGLSESGVTLECDSSFRDLGEPNIWISPLNYRIRMPGIGMINEAAFRGAPLP